MNFLNKMTILENLTSEEIKYFKGIDAKLRSSQNFHSRVYGEVSADNYADSKLEAFELQKILDLFIKKKDIIFYPVNTSMGFAVGFQFLKLDNLDSTKKIKKELLLRFREDQLPKGYTFQNLSPFFMMKENIKKAKIIGEEIVNNYEHYDY